MGVAFQERRGEKAKCKRRQVILKERQTPEVGKRRAFVCRAGAADATQDEETRRIKREALRQVKSKSSKVVVVVVVAALLAAVMGRGGIGKGKKQLRF